MEVYGEKIPINKEFKWAGKTWQLPALYVCAEGLAVDFCIEIPASDINTFFEKWDLKKRMAAIENEEMEDIISDDPFCLHYQPIITINGIELEQEDTETIPWYPPAIEEFVGDELVKERLSAYSCDPNQGWLFIRAIYRCQAKNMLPVKRITVELEPVPLWIPGERFSIATGEDNKELTFVHPLTGMKHLLKIHSCRQQQLTDDVFDGCVNIDKRMRHFVMLEYSLNPPIFVIANISIRLNNSA